MASSLTRPRAVFWGLAVASLVIDQGTKHWAETHLSMLDRITVWPGFFYLTYVRNTGIAFGLFGGNNIFWAVVALILLGLGIWAGRKLDWRRTETNVIGAWLLSGALGNLCDRIRYGYVVDFLDFYLPGYHWPTFNVADSCITLSVGWILFRTVVASRSHDAVAK